MATFPEPEDRMITWVGHGTALLELGGVRLLTDPVLGRRVGLLRRVAPPVPTGVTEGVEGVLISHAHADHLDAASLRRLPADVAFVAPGAAATWLRRRGFRNVASVTRGDRTTLAGVPVAVTPAGQRGRRRAGGPRRVG